MKLRAGRRFFVAVLASALGVAALATSATPAGAQVSPKPQKWAVIMVKPAVSYVGPAPEDPAAVSWHVYALAAYAMEASSDQIEPSVTTFGYYDSSITPADCSNYWGMINTAESLAHLNDADWDRVFVYMPNLGCAGGLTVVGDKHIWLNDLYINTLTHEYGHSLGFAHTGALDCDQLVAGNCTSNPAGDFMDGMDGSHQYNAFHKWIAGWLPDQDTMMVDPTHASATVVALKEAEFTDLSAPPVTQLIRIPRGNGHELTLEFRGPAAGIDGNSAFDYYGQPPSGTCLCVWVRDQGVYPNWKADGVEGQLYDMTPNTPSIDDGAFAAGMSFTDPLSGVKLTNLGRTGDTVQIKIETPGMVSMLGTTAVFRGTAANDRLTVRKVSTGVYEFADPAVAMSAASGCSMNKAVVRCTGVAKLDVHLAGGDDVVTISDPIPAKLDGGPGNDSFNGSMAADEFIGGDGYDVVSYLDHNGVKVTMGDGLANDGQPGEGDNVHSDIETFFSDRGADDVTAGPNALSINTGAANDRINVRNGVVDDVICGNGTDTVIADNNDVVHPGCESVTRG